MKSHVVHVVHLYLDVPSESFCLKLTLDMLLCVLGAVTVAHYWMDLTP